MVIRPELIPNMKMGRAYELRQVYNGKVNTSAECIIANIRRNIRRHLPQMNLWGHTGADRCILLGGGPSLDEHVDEIRKLRRAGWKLATLNGAHNWCADRELVPSVHIQLDARDFNARFVERPVPTCAYLIASQSSPKVFDRLENNNVWIWHGVSDPKERAVLDKFYLRRWINVHGGTTVGTRAPNLLHMMGFNKINVYGMDSCLRGGKHHAYAQEENNSSQLFEVRSGNRRFQCHPWMAVQADEFMQMIPHYPDDLMLSFRGRGLLAHIIEQTANTGRPPPLHFRQIK